VSQIDPAFSLRTMLFVSTYSILTVSTSIGDWK